MAYTFRTQLFRIALGLCIVSSPCRAQISLDGSLGGTSGDLVIGGNNEFTIGEELGKQVGSNLFHSFVDFNHCCRRQCGYLTIRTDSLDVRDGVQVSASTSGDGESLLVEADSVEYMLELAAQPQT